MPAYVPLLCEGVKSGVSSFFVISFHVRRPMDIRAQSPCKRQPNNNSKRDPKIENIKKWNVFFLFMTKEILELFPIDSEPNFETVIQPNCINIHHFRSPCTFRMAQLNYMVYLTWNKMNGKKYNKIGDIHCIGPTPARKINEQQKKSLAQKACHLNACHYKNHAK